MTGLRIYNDPARSASERADDLLQQMTLDEKIAQMGSYWVYQLLDGTTFSPEKADFLIGHGVGQISRVGGASNLRPAQSAALTNHIQKFLIENTRLGIPAVVHEECCSGYMARGATVFPQAIGLASTWDNDLVKAMAEVIRRQMRSVGAHHALAPVLDVARDARWGRVEETFGEDPYLAASLGIAYIRGMQSDDLKDGIVATAKHFVGYSMSEGGLNWAPSHIAPRELREVFLFPFEAAVREAKLASVMNAYHELDGVPCGSSKELLTAILRQEWGFDGTVVSDYFAIAMLNEYHHVARTKMEAAQVALEAGLDVELPFTDCFGNPLREAVMQGKVSVALLDIALQRILLQKFALGLFDNPYVDPGSVTFDTPEQRQLARIIAQKSLVLLKNESPEGTGSPLLPLDKAIPTIAVIGPNADSIRNLFGDYAFPAHIETLIDLKNHGNIFNQPLPDDIESAEDFIAAISVLDAIKAKVNSGTKVVYARGCDILDGSRDGFAEAVEAARQAELALVVVGDKAGLTDDCTSGEARDRADLTLPGVQSQLVQAIYDTGTPIVLVLVTGRPVTLGWIADSVPAILEAWFPAEEGANAVADVLFGDANPGGKLPITFPRSVGQVPIFYGHRPSGGRSHWKGDYVETSVKAQYPFGYGLSYTHFEFTNLRIEPATVQAGEEVTVSVDLTNVGQRAGDEVVQLYVRQEVPLVTRPVKELKAFKRVTLEPKETRTIVISLAANQMGFYDRDDNFVLEPGHVEVMIGASAEDILCTGTFEIQGERRDIREAKVFLSKAHVI
ncbi:MAG TPA: glycoside hydrolase family 3 N-terminal domain-containing protein [Aggregatilineales bacterium]|nr:glycoside hydrolase family 3 N-terminal domain-containing protein [Aggregatilineales bacterium]